jgi:hypothetical protein
MREQIGDSVWVTFFSTLMRLFYTLRVGYFSSLLSDLYMMSTYQHTKYYHNVYISIVIPVIRKGIR